MTSGTPYRYQLDDRTYQPASLAVTSSKAPWIGSVVLLESGRTITAFDVESGDEIAHWTVDTKTPLDLAGVALSGDQRWIYTIGRNYESDIWMLEK
jgi:hypothetical protein